MVWVRSEYAEELAVVLAWLSALLPWNVAFSDLGDAGDLLFVRFPLVQVRYTYGVPLAEGVLVHHPLAAIDYQQGQSVAVAYRVWALGALLVAAALALSFALYLREERVAAASFDSVRAMGGLLGGAAVVLTVATVLLWTNGLPAIHVPLGVVLLYVFGGVLLTVERT